MQPDPTPHERHTAAVARSLAAADDCAQEGDFINALAWLATIKAIGDELPAEYTAKEESWRLAVRHAVRDASNGTGGVACPRCGLTIWPRAAALRVRYCPRCMARARAAVEMLPASQVARQTTERSCDQARM